MYYLWSLPWGISLVVQIFFAVHAYRRGNTYWIFIILFFPVAGVLVYFFVEYLPELRSGGGIERASAGLARKLAPERELRRLKQEVEFNNSVSNRIELAKAHVDVGQYDEAIEILNGCNSGIHENDPKILLILAPAYIGAGKMQEALDTLTLLRTEHPRSDAKGTGLLMARTLEHMGDLEGACHEYEAILPDSVGEEVRCRYALLLKELGRDDDAKAAFEEILMKVKVSPRFYRKAQREWIQIAKRELQPQ
jgi:hypothetical protein